MTTTDQAAADQRPASVEERVDAALDVCDDLLTVLPRLIQRMDTLEQARSALSPGDQASDFRFESYPAPSNQDEHNGQVARVREVWQRLTEWVDWLVATYRLTSVIPACWPEHPAIVEELKALFVTWAGAWLGGAGADAPAGWQRRLHDAKARLADGNWGTPRCGGDHDGTGLDLADHFESWRVNPARDKAIIAARDRSIAGLPAVADGGED